MGDSLASSDKQVFSDGTVNDVTTSQGAFPNVTRTRVAIVGGNPSVLVLAKNNHRLGATIDNPAGGVKVLLGLGPDPVDATDFTVELAAGDYYEVPFGFTASIFAYNPIGGTVTLRVTEITPGAVE